MASVAASSTDFRRSNHERSHSESSLWIDDYLNGGLNAEELFDTPSRSCGINLLAPFEDGEDLQSALSSFIPECVFSEFDSVEPVDIETVDAEQLFRNSLSSRDFDFQIPNQVSNDVQFALPATPRVRSNSKTSVISSPKKNPPSSPIKWSGAHPREELVKSVPGKSEEKSIRKEELNNKTLGDFEDKLVSKEKIVTSKERQESRPKSRNKEKRREKRSENSLVKKSGKSPKESSEKISSKSEKRSSGADKSSERSLAKDKGKSASKEKPVNSDKSSSKNKSQIKLVEKPVEMEPEAEVCAKVRSQQKLKLVPMELLEKLKAASKKTKRQSILISTPVTQQTAKRCVVSLDHDYCGDLTKGERDDLEVQPMEVESEDERATNRIEVLPDLRLRFAEENVPTPRKAHPRSLLKINHPPPSHVLEDCANFVVTEEVVISMETGSASSDSGFESSIRAEEDDSEESSRRWKDGSKTRHSLSDSSSDEDELTSRRSRRKRRRSSSRRRTSLQSGSPSPRRSYKKRRSYSRESSVGYNSGSEIRRSRGSHKPERRERKNIWASLEKPPAIPFMPPLNKPGQKSMMQSALEEIGRGGDRQVLYVGQIQEGTTRNEIREKFDRFGPIAEVSVHFRETGENYAFVTFNEPKDAYRALENADSFPSFKLCFGGRRQFCGRKWSDLDNEQERTYQNTGLKDLAAGNDDFDSLLKQVKTASLRR